MHLPEAIGILTSLTAVASYINYRFIKLPKSIGLTLITLILSILILLSSKLGWNLNNFANIFLQEISFNKTFLNGMLSFLLFAGSLHVNSMELAKHKFLIALLATFSVALSTLLIGSITLVMTQYLGISITPAYCYVFGALISPTDPIAVLGILKRVNAPKALEMKIAGEALFNDGMGIVLFVVILGIASGETNHISLTSVSWYFMQMGVGGLIFGLILGTIASYMLYKVDDYEIAVLITLALVTGGYTFCESILDVSGPICMAAAGLVVGSSLNSCSMGKETVDRLESFWELIDEVLNAILFVLIGLEFVRLTLNYEVLIASIGAIIITLAVRWISVALPVASLSVFKTFKLRIVTLMTWGGLRGGISIALALSLEPSVSRDFIVSITYAVVLFSIIVQGLTIAPLLRRLTK